MYTQGKSSTKPRVITFTGKLIQTESDKHFGVVGLAGGCIREPGFGGKSALKIFLLSALLLFSVGKCLAQEINTISTSCPPPDRRFFSQVRTDASGNIIYDPCPRNGTNIFSGYTDFSNSTINPPLRLLDKNYANFQGHRTLLSVASTTPYQLPLDAGGHSIETDLTFTGQAAPAVGLYARINALTTHPGGSWSSDPSTFGVYAIATNLGETNIERSITGVSGIAYLRSPQARRATGGFFEAVTGGNSDATNVTPLFGVIANASGGHNGTTPLAVAGKFNVTNIGGGGVGNITEGIAIHALFDGGFPTTNYTAAKGIALQGWGAASGGSYATSYGIYADASIDRGAMSRYFIYSLSTSPSLFSGVIRVAQDIYVTDQTKGLVLKSPDNTCYRFTVANDGALNPGTAITCP